jgi:hypothetical protein
MNGSTKFKLAANIAGHFVGSCMVAAVGVSIGIVVLAPFVGIGQQQAVTHMLEHNDAALSLDMARLAFESVIFACMALGVPVVLAVRLMLNGTRAALADAKSVSAN